MDYVANHFGCKIQERVYDITGDVTEQYKWEPGAGPTVRPKEFCKR